MSCVFGNKTNYQLISQLTETKKKWERKLSVKQDGGAKYCG